MAYSKKKAPFVLWLTIPFAILCSLLYITVVLYVTDNGKINYLSDDNPGVYVTAKERIKYKLYVEQDFKVLYDKTYTIPKGERLLAIFERGVGVVVERPNGDRISVEEKKLDGDLTELPEFNSSFKYYVKGDESGSIFIGKHIDDVVNEYGSYDKCYKKDGVYYFDQLTLVDGKNKYECWCLLTDSSGIVKDAFAYYDRWNLYGFLPFYDRIVSLNIFNTRCSDIYRDQVGFFYGLLIFVLLMATPLATYIPKKEEIGDTRWLPSVFVNIYGLYSFVVEYIFIISFVEFSHEWWLITMPLAMTVAFSFSIVQINLVLESVSVYCDKCGAKNSLSVTRTKLEESYHYEYVTHSKDGKRVKHKGYGLNSGEEIWEGSRRTRTTRCKITKIRYLEETRCKNCDYYSSREVTEEFRGPNETVSRTNEKTHFKEV